MLKRLKQDVCRANRALAEVLDDTERELDIFDRYGDSFGYVFYLMQKPGEAGSV